MRTKILTAILVVLLIMGALLLYRAKHKEPSTSINWVEPTTEEIHIQATSEKCRLENGPCKISWGQSHWAELEMSPSPFRSNKEIQIILKTSSDWIKPESIDLEGINLNMGYIRPLFQKKSEHLYAAHVQLPLCEEKKMQWRAVVLFKEENSSGLQGLTYFFSSQEE